MFNFIFIYMLCFFKVGKEMFYYNEKDWNEVNCQYCCGKYFVYYVGIYCVLCVRIGIMIDNQWQYVENKGQRGYQDWV